jgi:hypothetical protein
VRAVNFQLIARRLVSATALLIPVFAVLAFGSVRAGAADDASGLPGLFGSNTGTFVVRPEIVGYGGNAIGWMAGHPVASKQKRGVKRIPKLKWDSWTAEKAVAKRSGEWANDCTPYCAKGRFHGVPVKLTAYRPVRGHFTRMRAEKVSGHHYRSGDLIGIFKLNWANGKYFWMWPGAHGPTHDGPPLNPREFHASFPTGRVDCGIYDPVEQVICSGFLDDADLNSNIPLARVFTDGHATSCIGAGASDASTTCGLGNLGEGAPTLGVGDQSVVGPFTCVVQVTSVKCTLTATGQGFEISPTEIVLLGQ